jgi:hypothetical protein
VHITNESFGYRFIFYLPLLPVSRLKTLLSKVVKRRLLAQSKPWIGKYSKMHFFVCGKSVENAG